MQRKIITKPSDIQYFDHIKGELAKSQQYKALKFLEFNCIEEADNILVKNRIDDHNHFICKPIEGYNIRTYDLIWIHGIGWECNCQGFKKSVERNGRSWAGCSHVLALTLFLKGVKHEKKM